MAELFTNMLYSRALQFGAALFFTAVFVTNVDVKSVIVGNEPPMPTQRFSPPTHITTMQPSPTPSIYSTDIVNIPHYDPTTSFLDSSAVKNIYVFDYVLDKPTAGTPRPEASAKPPRRPFETTSTAKGSSADTSALPRRSRMDQPSRADENSTRKLSFSNQSPPNKRWIPKSVQDLLFEMKVQIQGVLVEVKERILMSFPSMVPSFGMIAWLQFRYMQYLGKITTAEDFKFIKLKLASHTNAKDREIQILLEELENSSKRAVNAAEAAAAAKQNSDQKSANEIARLRALVQEGENALTEEQEASKQKLRKAAEETARLLTEKNSALEKEKESFSKAFKRVKDDGHREAKRLTDLAIQKNAETARRRRADKAIIDDLKKQSATDTTKILELTKKVGTIAEKDETIVIMGAEKRRLTKAVKDLTKERDRAMEDGVNATAANKAKIAQLNAQVIEADTFRKAAEAKALEQEGSATEAIEQREAAEERATQLSAQVIEANNIRKTTEAKMLEQEALAAKATKLRKVAEERATQEENRAAQAEANCKTAEEKASQEEVKATEAVERLKAKNERVAALEDQRQEKPVCSDTVAPSSDPSSQGLSTLPQPRPTVRFPPPRPVVRFPTCAAPSFNTHPSAHQPSSANEQCRTQGVGHAATRPVPRWEPPTKTRTPPEERGLPSSTPTGPMAERGGVRN